MKRWPLPNVPYRCRQLTEIGDRPAVNEVYKEYFPSNPPGRTCFGGAQFDGNTRIEIEMVAVVES